MPVEDAGFGFTNRWYSEVVRTASTVTIGGVDIRVASLPSYLATKVEAFLGRGGSDWRSSHDLEDVLSLLDASSDVVELVDGSAEELRAFLIETFRAWLAPASDLVTIGGLTVTVGGEPLVVGETSPIEEHARSHFPGDEAGEIAAEVSLERMRRIAALDVR